MRIPLCFWCPATLVIANIEVCENAKLDLTHLVCYCSVPSRLSDSPPSRCCEVNTPGGAVV